MALRGSTITEYVASSAGTIKGTLPSGSIVGDLCILLADNDAYHSGLDVSLASGWTLLWAGTYQAIAGYKVLDSTDISNGYVFVNDLGLAPYNAIISVVVMVGTVVVREAAYADMTPTVASYISTTSAPVVGDGVVVLGHLRTGSGTPSGGLGPAICLDRGIQLTTTSNAYWTGAIWTNAVTVAGVYTQGFSTNLSGVSPPIGFDGIVVVVEGAGFASYEPSLVCGSPINGTVGVGYTHTFPIANLSGDKTFSITSGSLPPGLTLNAATGVLTGTPTAVGSYAFSIKVMYGAQYGYPSNPLPFSLTASCTILTVVMTFAQPLGLCVEVTPWGVYVHSDVWTDGVFNSSMMTVASRRNVYIKMPLGGSGMGGYGNVTY